MDDQYSYCLKIVKRKYCVTNCYNYLLVVTALTDGQDGETDYQSFLLKLSKEIAYTYEI